MVERIDDHDVCFKKWAILSLIFVVLNQFLQYKICLGLSEIPTRNIRVESEYADHVITLNCICNTTSSRSKPVLNLYQYNPWSRFSTRQQREQCDLMNCSIFDQFRQRHFAKVGSKNCQIQNKCSQKIAKDSKNSQSGEISANLVTPKGNPLTDTSELLRVKLR